MRVVLTIAGSDSSGGAGVQADLKTFQASGVYGVCVITVVTAQNSRRVCRVYPLSAGAVQAQIDALLADVAVDAVKTGMLWNESIIRAVRRSIERHRLRPLVVDPVILSHGGDRLLTRTAEDALIKNLFPLADVVTPNIHEAERLAGLQIKRRKHIIEAARRIAEKGPGAVLIKGGHRGRQATDWFYDGNDLSTFTLQRVARVSMHGSGCILSAAIAAGMAKGLTPAMAIRKAKAYVTKEIRRSWKIGRGGITLALHRQAENRAGVRNYS
jgi:hydroxymethylpyrimidine/phosphomethylpyrimidine kinase